MDTGCIDKVPNWYGDRKEGDIITPLLWTSAMMYDFEDENDKYDDGDTYDDRN